MTIWFTSDTHYGHKNIVRGVSSWGDQSGCRDFDTITEMNDAMVASINEHVQTNDTLYHIGDWAMGGFDNTVEFRKRLHCKTVHIVYGNHDHHIRNHRKGLTPLFSSIQAISVKKLVSIG